MIYAEINAEKFCTGLLETTGSIKAAHMIEVENYDKALLGQRWTGTAWETVAPTEEDKAKDELEKVEREAGMNRAFREALLIIGEKLGVELPRLQKQENRAKAARAKLKAKD